jgi:hypothetical protein
VVNTGSINNHRHIALVLLNHIHPLLSEQNPEALQKWAVAQIRAKRQVNANLETPTDAAIDPTQTHKGRNTTEPTIFMAPAFLSGALGTQKGAPGSKKLLPTNLCDDRFFTLL